MKANRIHKPHQNYFADQDWKEQNLILSLQYQLLQNPFTPSLPCIHAAFRVKDHPSPAIRWFTTPSPAPSSAFRSGQYVADGKITVFQKS